MSKLTLEELFALFHMFVTQAQAGKQETKKYQQKLAGFDTHAGFGIGRRSRVPWFGFFAKGQSAQCGIYPVCLYYKEHDLFIVAYGVSETTPPPISWGAQVSDKATVFNELEKRGISYSYKNPSKTRVMYGDSFVKACFEHVSSVKNIKDSIFEGIYLNTCEIIDEYQQALSSVTPAKTTAQASPEPSATTEAAFSPEPPASPVTPPSLPYVEPDFPTIEGIIQKSGLVLDDRTLRRYHLSLKNRKFVILAGVSGTGKTWLAEEYANAVGAESLNIPVAPNWTSNEDLLGFHNPVSNAFQPTDFTLFLEQACAAQQQADEQGITSRPFHLILDEMNLARVEHYFARFLAAMELRQRHAAPCLFLGPGKELFLPANLHFIGTVNVDETTHGFADKVFDRAQLIELPLNRHMIAARLDGRDYAMPLMAFWDTLRDVAPFAFRVLDDIDAYIQSANALGTPWNETLDEMLVQKVLPRIKGNDSRLAEVFDTLDAIAAEYSFSLVKEKIAYMRASYHEHGFTSFFY